MLRILDVHLKPLLEQDPEFYNFLQATVYVHNFDGESAIPYNLNGEFIYYNKQVFADSKLTVPETWEDLNIIKTTKENGIIPIALGNAEI